MAQWSARSRPCMSWRLLVHRVADTCLHAGPARRSSDLADTASDGVEALEKLAKVPVDVILTDLNMPGMDGFELLDKLRSMGDSPPSIVLTAYGSMDSAIKTVHELGAFWFLEKPIQASAL